MSKKQMRPHEGATRGALAGGTGKQEQHQNTENNANAQSLRPRPYLLVDLETGRLDGYYAFLDEAQEMRNERNAIDGQWSIFLPVDKAGWIGKAPFEAAREQILRGMQ
jgi:hypothetical protein